mmetsp:Transcript_3557/g.7196  ORF Transcript_3557/g.7196 Transcript_3557/m.7196 type:complete len:201 (-) Transcript_3557:205-807(-)
MSISKRIPLFFILAAFVFNAIAANDDDTPPQQQANTKYFFACSSEDLSSGLSIVKDLLSQDESLAHTTTNDGEHCLHLSALGGNEELVQLLLEKGADPNIRSTFVHGLRMHPLSWSVYYGRYKIIELLLKHGADVNADFDVKRGPDEVQPVTALDVVEEILLQIEDGDENTRERFIETRNVLVRNGARRYISEYGADGEL